MTTATGASAPYENPLIPNARLRQIYLAMLGARMLEKALPATRRARAADAGGKGYATGIAGLEACLVATAADLGPGDLVSDPLAGGVVEFLRGATLDAVLDTGSGPGQRAKKLGVATACESTSRLPCAPGTAERIWSAMGAAAALQAQATHGKEASRRGVVMLYARPGELAGAMGRSALRHAAERQLPVVFAVMPRPRQHGAAGRPGATSLGTASLGTARLGTARLGTARPGAASALAHRCGVPGIAVDANDAVAIYRVAQESIARARAGGGAALIECVPFAVQGAKVPAGDALLSMEGYLLHRGIATKAWLAGEARRFASNLASHR